MGEFILVVVIYANQVGGGFQLLPMEEYASKKECEEYAIQTKRDFAEPSRTLKASCYPKAAMPQFAGPAQHPPTKGK